MVKFVDVFKSYGQRFAVNNLNLEVNEGEFLVLIGPSGCGKTTTLKMVNRLVEPDSGTILVRNQDIREMNRVSLRREIGYVIQQIGLFPNMTVEQNIDMVPRLLGWDAGRRQARVHELLEMVSMNPADYASRYPNELSGGEQQRIGVLRALAAEPPLILMDEPFGALDPITRETLQDELKRLQGTLRKTVIFVTHDMDEALKLADRIAIMREGNLEQVASPDSLLRHPANDFVASFIGVDRINGQGAFAVDQVMLFNPVVAQPDLGLAEALALMRNKRVDTLLVVDRDRHFLGTVDIEQFGRGYSKAHVADLMEEFPHAVGMTTSAREAFDLMSSNKLKYLPVLDQEGRLAGLVTRAGMVKAIASALWGDDNE